MLGLKWGKEEDSLVVVIPVEETQPMKRGILGKMAKIYDPLGLIAPLTLTAKQIYREFCKTKAPWDAKINGALLQCWKKREEQLLHEQQVPRPIDQSTRNTSSGTTLFRGRIRTRSRRSSLCSCTPTIWEHLTISGRQESTCQTGADYTTPRIDCSAHGYQSVDKRTQRSR